LILAVRCGDAGWHSNCFLAGMTRKIAVKCCPKCGGREVISRTVRDLVTAVDSHGYIFEMDLQLPVWRCNACKFGWQGREALAAKEAAYQFALKTRPTMRISA
jgi:ribosomal protein L37AE/L43A